MIGSTSAQLDARLAIVVLRDNSRDIDHAVLGDSTHLGNFKLDNVGGQISRDTQGAQYEPLFLFSATHSWIHGVQTGNSNLNASAGVLFAKIATGETVTMPNLLISN
jgi:hypothetical protein